MTEQAEAPPGSLDTAKLVLAVLLALGGVVAYHVFSTQPGWLRWLMVAGGLVLGAGAFVLSAYGRMLVEFVSGARIELRKMVWPTVPETRNTTLMVFAFVAVAGVFFWVVDWLLAIATRNLLGQG